MVVHTLNLSTPEAKAGEIKASLVCTVSCRTARAMEKNPVSKPNNKNGFQGLNSYLHASKSLTLPTEPSPQPRVVFIYFIYLHNPFNPIKSVFLTFRRWLNRERLIEVKSLVKDSTAWKGRHQDCNPRLFSSLSPTWGPSLESSIYGLAKTTWRP